MNHHYNDITKRIPEKPKWWDENAVPRYCKFAPNETADIYATEAALVLIECQSCGTPFHACLSDSLGSRVVEMRDPEQDLAALIREQAIHYGDPPNTECCPAGPTMNSVPIRVVEFWRQTKRVEWERDAALEIYVRPDWADEGEG